MLTAALLCCAVDAQVLLQIFTPVASVLLHHSGYESLPILGRPFKVTWVAWVAYHTMCQLTTGQLTAVVQESSQQSSLSCTTQLSNQSLSAETSGAVAHQVPYHVPAADFGVLSPDLGFGGL